MITGCAEWCSRVAEGLQLLARRIRTFPEGNFTPSPPPPLLSTLTDELLVIASDAVKAVAAEGKALSGNGGLRLLAWTVADARGATAALDKPLALTVGRRLDSRAFTVRKDLEAAAEEDRVANCSYNHQVMEQAAKKKARDEVLHRLLGAGVAAAARDAYRCPTLLHARDCKNLGGGLSSRPRRPRGTTS